MKELNFEVIFLTKKRKDSVILLFTLTPRDSNTCFLRRGKWNGVLVYLELCFNEHLPWKGGIRGILLMGIHDLQEGPQNLNLYCLGTGQASLWDFQSICPIVLMAVMMTCPWFLDCSFYLGCLFLSPLYTWYTVSSAFNALPHLHAWGTPIYSSRLGSNNSYSRGALADLSRQTYTYPSLFFLKVMFTLYARCFPHHLCTIFNYYIVSPPEDFNCICFLFSLHLQCLGPHLSYRGCQRIIC